MQVNHVKTNGHYEIVGICVLEATGRLAVRYKKNGSSTEWVRDAAEFFDGRFQAPEIAHDMRNEQRVAEGLKPISLAK